MGSASEGHGGAVGAANQNCCHALVRAHAARSGKAIAAAHGRQERWGRLVESQGQTGAFEPAAALVEPGLDDAVAGAVAR